MLRRLRLRRRRPTATPPFLAGPDLDRLLAQDPRTYDAGQIHLLRSTYASALERQAPWAAELHGTRLDQAQRRLIYAGAVVMTSFVGLWTVGNSLPGWGRTAVAVALCVAGAIVYVGLDGALHERLVRRMAAAVAAASSSVTAEALVAVAEDET